MKKAALLLIIVFLVGISVFSQDYKGKGRIAGNVYDEEGNPIEGVKVKLLFTKTQSGFEVLTNAKGKWKASWIRGGGCNVDFEKAGYMPKGISIQIKEYSQNPAIEVKLKKVEGLVLRSELVEALTEGNNLFEEGKREEAIEIYEKIIEEFPEAYIVNKNIGTAYFQMEKYDRAEECYMKILEKEPNNNDVILLIGNCYANRGQNEKALEWYHKIEFEKIDNPTVLYNIGTNYYNVSDFQGALKYYKKAVEIQEGFLDGLYQLGLTHLTLGNYKGAIDVFESYIKQDPDSEKASQVKGFIEFLKKQI